MPLRIEGLLPLLAVLLAAGIIRIRPRARENGWLAAGATIVAGSLTLLDLLRLAPGERVDIPYLTTFPYADLAMHLDALSLAFATFTLTTAAFLMLVRLRTAGDRRDPWFGWLLTTAAVLAVILCTNLLLLYLLLQVLTLAWSGALDETLPRRRVLRLTVQVADIGLLLVAASAIQSVGTSAFSGVPSDTFGLAAFGLALLPVVARIGAIAWLPDQTPAPVAFEAAIAWMAPAGYLSLRIISLMGGRVPDRAAAVALFSGALAVACIAGIAALRLRGGLRLATYVLVAQAAIALGLLASSEPSLTIASTWLWLLLIPLAGVATLSLPSGSAGAGLAATSLAMLPGSFPFIAVWLAGVGLGRIGLMVAILPIGAAVLLAALAALSRVALPRVVGVDLPTLWAAALLVVAALPAIMLTPIVIPAAAAVRAIPGGTLRVNLFGITAGAATWPALPVTVALVAALALLAWSAAGRGPLLRSGAPLELRLPWPRRIGRLPPAVHRWLWPLFALVATVAILRP